MYAHVRRVSADLRASRDALNAPVVVSFNVSPIPFCRFFFYRIQLLIVVYLIYNPIPRVSFLFLFFLFFLLDFVSSSISCYPRSNFDKKHRGLTPWYHLAIDYRVFKLSQFPCRYPDLIKRVAVLVFERGPVSIETDGPIDGKRSSYLNYNFLLDKRRSLYFGWCGKRFLLSR